MITKTKLKIVMICFAAMAMLTVDCWVPTGTNWIPEGFFVGEAEAVVGRPLTPVSVAGVARRTSRRTVRRTAHRY